MVIYLDVLMAVNVYITYFTLKATARLLHLGYKTGRLIFASVLGGISALAAVLPVNFIGAILIRAATTSAVTIAAFGFPGLKPMVIRCGVNIAGGAFICGAAILLREFTGSDLFGAAAGYAYFNISVMTLILATTAVYIAITLFRRFSDRPAQDEIINVKISNNGKTAVVRAFPDSGNNLRDFFTGLPVIVCRKEKIAELFPFEEESGTIPKGARILPFSSVGGDGVITAFRAESITLCRENGTEKTVDVLIGASENALADESFDAILNPKILI